MDTKYLTDIPNYHVPMHQHDLPRFQYTIRDESTGTFFLSDSTELSKTDATLAAARFLEHLTAFGIPCEHVQIRTDQGSEFDGETIHSKTSQPHRVVVGTGRRRWGGLRIHVRAGRPCPINATDVETAAGEGRTGIPACPVVTAGDADGTDGDGDGARGDVWMGFMAFLNRFHSPFVPTFPRRAG